jgi:hypothetical protein
VYCCCRVALSFPPYLAEKESTIQSTQQQIFTMSEVRKPTLIESMACGGAAAAFAVNFTHPIELVKTRMQVSGAGIGETVAGVMKNGGVGAFWKGLPFGWGRELSYTSIKLGACE